MSSLNPSMEDLPPHLTLDILARLPVKTIIHSKCVCKKWRNLVSDAYFTNLHLSKSPEGLLIHHQLFVTGMIRRCYPKAGILKWVEIEDEPDHHQLHHDPVMSLDLSLASFTSPMSHIRPVGSVNGLICLWQSRSNADNTYICNPITREYMILPRHQCYNNFFARIIYGFGVGLQSKEYKVVRTFQKNTLEARTRPSLIEADIYTLGTGHWRSLGHVPYCLEGYDGDGPFLNGHAHWIVVDKDSPEKLCTFDFDNETFQLFPSPPSEPIDESKIRLHSLGVLKGCLCQVETFDSQIMIWVMKEYGVKKSWHKEVVIKESISPDLDWVMRGPIYVMKGLKDGTILMLYKKETLLAYCPRRKTIVDTQIFDRYFSAMAYCPSFIKLQNFEIKEVHVF